MQVPGWLGNRAFQPWSPKEYQMKRSHKLQTVYFAKYNLPKLTLDLYRISRLGRGGESDET